MTGPGAQQATQQATQQDPAPGWQSPIHQADQIAHWHRLTPLIMLAAMLLLSPLAAPLAADTTPGVLQSVVVDLAPGEAIVLEHHEDAGVKIDGHLNEAIWGELDAYDEFLVIEPDTLVQPTQATRVRIFFDLSGLYVGIDMDQPHETLVARLSGRDVRRLSRDSINLTLDTSGEGRYGYWFGLNLGDSLIDGTLLPERLFTSDWDGAWRAASQVTQHGWSGEFHIPWGTVAMPRVEGKRRIGFYMSRKVASIDERWGWPGLPATVPKFISALQSLELTGVDPRQQFSIYPFTAVTQRRIDNQIKYRAGADFFWRPSTNFQLTATVNPDFGAVESDDVVINLTATETFFPEKRLFFLEGQEVFVTSPRADTRGRGVGNRGAPVTLINTRRIGGFPAEPVLDSEEVDLPARELVQPVDLIGAIKLTGQHGRFRYGVLGAFEDDIGFDAMMDDRQVRVEGEVSDYGVARVIYEDEPGGAYRAFGAITTATLNAQGNALTHGIDGHYLGDDGKWKIDAQLFMSDLEHAETGFGGFLDFEYTFRKGVFQRLGIEYFDKHVDINDLGFQQRADNLRIRSAHVRTSSDLSWARDNQLDVRGYVQRNADGLFTGGAIFFSDRAIFNNLSRLTVRAGFFAGNYDDLNSFGKGTYRIEERRNLSVRWSSDFSRELSYGFGAGFKDEDLGGDTWNANFTMTWRPGDQFGLSGSVNYWDRSGWLLHQEEANFTTFKAEQWAPKINAEYFINARQQFKLSLQWVGIKAVEQAFYKIPARPGSLLPVAKPAGPTDSFSLSQMSLQLRYRWEIAPLSDVFLVYTRLVDDGSRLKNFSDVFSDGYNNPLVELLTFKIRYRFGS